MTETTRILFRGRIQGVFFRATAKEIADSLDIKGYARNLADGDVELFVQGPKENIEKLEQQLLKAFFCQITKKETLSSEALSDFKILRI